MNKTHPSFVHIIGQYHKLLERYAHRYMVNKHMAYSVAKETFEFLYDKGKLVNGPHLRTHLKDTARNIWQDIDATLERAEKALANNLLNNNNS